MSKNSDFFAQIREEEYDDYRQDQIYLEEQKWMEEEEYWDSLKKKAIIIDMEKQEKQKDEKIPL